MRWKEFFKDTFQLIYETLIVLLLAVYLFSGFGIMICVAIENIFGHPYGFILMGVNIAILLSILIYKIRKNYKY